MHWIDTVNDDTANLAKEKWEPILSSSPDGGVTASVAGTPLEGGEFWADAIKKLRENPKERLHMAERNLPVPVAWKEAAISLRALIKLEEKPLSLTSDCLKKLHFYAAIWSLCIPYSKVLSLPGYNVFESIPFSRFNQLDLSWNIIGCDELELLSKTDKKTMKETWGEPNGHTTAAAIYSCLWDEYEQKTEAEDRRSFSDEISRLLTR